MTTAYATHPDFIKHAMPGRNHPERPERLEAVWEQMRETGLIDRVLPVSPVEVSRELLLSVHTEQYVKLLYRLDQLDDLMMIDADTYMLPESPRIARLGAGAVVETIGAVMRGDADNGLVAVRPPGHHATPETAMGFCLLSNIAIGARYAQKQHGVNRVMIVDYDVHHGNGTQDAFYDDDSVLFISTHQSPFYPGTGHFNETGRGAGRGTTLNIPLQAGFGDEGYKVIFEEIVWKAAERFQPELILVSAGFDAHWNDPLAMMQLTLTGYAHLTRELIKMADKLCDGKIAFVMEGGYDLMAVGHGMRNIAHALLNEDEISDPYGAAPRKEPDIMPVIERVQSIHDL
ncbi:MAG: histone deacetylase [Aggregatilineales bacterium]